MLEINSETTEIFSIFNFDDSCESNYEKDEAFAVIDFISILSF